jgi:O-antigen/teichoic acid export membrane protein
MSATRRIFSGSAAAWSRIVVTLFGQVLLVPVLLSHWSLEQYGCWLIIQSVTGMSTVLSFGHQNFIGFEFLKCGAEKTHQLALIFYSSIPYAIIIGLIELIIVLMLIYLGLLNTIFDPYHSLSAVVLNEATTALVIQSIVWLMVSCIGGLAGRLLAPLGHYPKNAWWGVCGTIITLSASVTAVLLGAGLLMTVIAVAIATVLYNIPLYFDFWNILKINKLHPVRPDMILGFNNVKKSFAVAANTFLDLLRQQGLRVFISALVGIKEMAAFSTLRTASNVALQELMRFLRNQDQDRTDATLAFVWFCTVILLAPSLVILQFIMPDIFSIWTRGKIEYDPLVFGLFSMSIIIFAVGQPAAAVLQGNNLLKEQLFITTLTAIISILGVIFFAPKIGIRGAAFVLVIAESVGTFFLVKFASRWLSRNGMNWPWGLFKLTSVAAFLSISILLVISTYKSVNGLFLAASIGIGLAQAWLFIRAMPNLAISKIKNMASKLYSQ